MGKNIVLLDLVFYVILPLICWNGLRESIGDYYAMLASSVPAIIYSLYRFYEVKRINITGLYIIIILVIGTLIDVLAGSAMQLLWNNVYYSLALCTFFLMTILIKKPMALYFALDFVELQGDDRVLSKHLFYQKTIFILFQFVTLLFALRSGLLAAIKVWLISEYGVEAFDKGIIVKQTISWLITALTVIGFLYIKKVINDNPDLLNKAEKNNTVDMKS
ncbi:VC0807 family protein [Bacillus solimangrovi]|uniref:Intracellular septation protein A n=1 Tax=Bacillus solimangrovi TaxID=1305675 RepID=A0A1E5LAQ8_9BACI|nr:VC0807 family protein [Bacillus solimangrovi]OEH91069.1 hypothetical protein BFG57_06765 [Bacillus solimangrovi]